MVDSPSIEVSRIRTSRHDSGNGSRATTGGGSESGPRTFDILVDNRKLATQTLSNNKPEQFWDATYRIPPELTKGKEKLTVKLQAHPGNFAGGLFGCRMVRAEEVRKQ